MHQFIESNNGNDINRTILGKERIRILESLSREQKKLEAMVLELFEKGDFNMGTDKRILKQSDVLDKLIVDEMMLHEMKEKYFKG
ncbi:MAG: hypothetical protein ACOX8Q_02115 [Christensenellales bacterium]|jgi:hypothetical protein